MRLGFHWLAGWLLAGWLAACWGRLDWLATPAGAHSLLPPAATMRRYSLGLIYAFWALAWGTLQAVGTVHLPKWFSDGMVLQTSDGDGPPAFLAGRTTPPGEQVVVSGDVGEHKVVSEDDTGLWKVALGRSSSWRNADKGMTISVRGTTGAAVIARGVLAGDGACLSLPMQTATSRICC